MSFLLLETGDHLLLESGDRLLLEESSASTLGLAISDHADGTGGTATITGSAGGNVTVYGQPVDGELGTAAWVARGSRSGDGAISLSPTPAKGYYWWHAREVGTSGASNFVYQNITDGLDSVHYRCLVAAQARTQLLLLDDLPSRQVYVRKVPVPRDVTFPAILITPIGREGMNPLAGTNYRDDVGYPVVISILAVDNEDTVMQEKYLQWRQKLARAFRNQRMPGVPEIINCVVEPDTIVDLGFWIKNYFHSALVVRCLSREPRGIAA